MSTGTFLVENALKRIGVVSIAVPSSPEQIIDGLNTLNSMIQIWLSWGIVLKTIPVSVPGDDLEEPVEATEAIIDNLALMISPPYSNGGVNIVSPRLETNATIGLSMVKSLYQELTIPDVVISSTAPVGAGNSKGVDSTTFFPRDSTLEN